MLFIGIVLTLILFALIAIANKLQAGQPTTVIIRPEIADVINEIREVADHEAVVSAVVKLVRQLDTDPDALQLVNSFPKTVQAAALMHYANELGSALHTLQAKEAEMLKAQRPNAAADVQRLIAKVRQQLDAVVAASGQTWPRSV